MFECLKFGKTFCRLILLSNFPNAPKITINFLDGEYLLLLENRQQCSFVDALPDDGNAIYHVDEGRTGIDTFIQDFPRTGGT